MNEYYTKTERKSPEKINKSSEKDAENTRIDNGDEEIGGVIKVWKFLLNIIRLLLKNMKEWLTT